MPAILKRHVDFNSKTDGEALIRAGELTTVEAAMIVGCTSERIRQLIKQHRIGRWEPRLRLFIGDRGKLAVHLARRKNR